MSMNVAKRADKVEMQYSASSHLGQHYLPTILEASQHIFMKLMDTISVTYAIGTHLIYLTMHAASI